MKRDMHMSKAIAILLAAAFLTGCAAPRSADEMARRQQLGLALSSYAAMRQQQAAQAAAWSQQQMVANQPQRVIVCGLPANSARYGC
jgi:hypothetical protein